MICRILLNIIIYVNRAIGWIKMDDIHFYWVKFVPNRQATVIRATNKK